MVLYFKGMFFSPGIKAFENFFLRLFYFFISLYLYIFMFLYFYSIILLFPSVIFRDFMYVEILLFYCYFYIFISLYYYIIILLFHYFVIMIFFKHPIFSRENFFYVECGFDKMCIKSKDFTHIFWKSPKGLSHNPTFSTIFPFFSSFLKRKIQKSKEYSLFSNDLFTSRTEQESGVILMYNFLKIF